MIYLNDLPVSFSSNEMKEYFLNLEPEILKKIKQNSILMHFNKGQDIIRENISSGGLFYIKKGTIKIFKTDNRGRTLTTGFMRDGDLFGLYSMLANGLNIYSAKAIDDCELLLIPKIIASSLFENDINFLNAANKLLSKKLVRLFQKITHISFKNVREGVALSIIELNETFDKDSNGFINVSLTKAEIAQMSNTTTAATIKLTNEFQKEKIIVIEDRKIKILDLPKLYKIADMIFPV